MKRIGNLYQKIISVENLTLADKNARKGKLHTYGVKVHDMNREQNIICLHDQLKKHMYHTSQYTTFVIHEPKERLIFRLPYYPDRIVHHAIMNVMENIWMSAFTSDSYSCIKGRGINGCRKKIQDAMRNDIANTRYCLKIDIKKFYPSIDHDILKNILRKKIKDDELLWLLDDIIDSTEGVPIGNYLSQYFANLYLTYFDHYIKEIKKIKHYYRYADDMVFLSSSKDELHRLLHDINNYMSSLKLKLKDNWQIFPIKDNHTQKSGRGVDYVGFVFYHRETRMRKNIKLNLCKETAKLNKKNISDKEYIQRISPWLGWAKYSDSQKLLSTILKSTIYEKIKLRPQA